MQRHLEDEEDFYQEFGGAPIKEDSKEEIEDPSIVSVAPEEEFVEEEEETKDLPEEGDEEDSKDAKKKSKQSVKEVISSLQREKYQTLDAIAKLQQENERLRQEALNYSQAAAYHYDARAQEKLARAKEEYRQALEANDYDAQTAAMQRVGEATAEIDRLNMAKAQEALQAQSYQEQIPREQEFYEVAKQNNVARWASENPWFIEKSEEYDPELSSAVHAFCNEYDANLYRNGFGHYIYSPEYLQEVNKFVSQARSERRRVNGDLNMRKSRSPISGVRGNQSINSGARIVLNPDEREFVENMKSIGVDEKSYIKYRELNRRKAKTTNEGRF